ncbi:ATP-grasp domain-containing protein [Paenibacillus sp. BAC0078]
MKTTVHCGSFESERFWREEDLAVLPAIPDASAISIVQAMDEMLFVFCGSDDVLLTRHGMEKAQFDYLRSLGHSFNTNLYPLIGGSDTSGTLDKLNVFELLDRLEPEGTVGSLIPEGAVLEPFAVLPGTQHAARRYQMSSNLPDEQTVRKVNTKTYSIAMRDRLALPNVGVAVSSITEMLKTGQQLLTQGPFLIKDEYGVSGKGNQLVDNERTLRRITGYLDSSRNKDKRIRFVLEPLLDRESDFSCQFYIDPAGVISILSVQQLVNNGFAFGESHSPAPGLLEKLERESYWELMHKIGKELYADGYHGDVCVDSMLLLDGTLAPLVEINARKSMSLIKHQVDRLINQEELHSCLIQVPLIPQSGALYGDLLQRLEQEGILFTLGSGEGVIPLSSGTLRPAGSGKGKLYAALVYPGSEHKNRLSLKLNEVLQGSGYTTLR